MVQGKVSNTRRSVLTCQFTTGLRPELKTKIVGLDDDFETLVVKSKI